MFLADLEARECKVYSQNGEDGVLAAIFEEIGVSNRYCVEFGCSDAKECNTANLLANGWRGLLMDAAAKASAWSAVFHEEFITAENVNRIFEKHHVPHAFDLLSIDIDGNDYWVWKALNFRPRVVLIEYNAHVPPQESKAVVYDPSFRWSGSDYFGASLRALKVLGERMGYTLVYCEQTGTNSFFVADEELPLGYEPIPLHAIYKPPNYFDKGLRWPRDAARRMVDPDSLSCAHTSTPCGFELTETGAT